MVFIAVLQLVSYPDCVRIQSRGAV